EWAILKRSQVLELKALGFKTVEHIARMDDQAIQRIGMGGRILRDRAKAFLDDAENIAQNSRLSADNERLMSEMAASSLDNLTSRRGRKPMPRDEAGNIIRDKVA